jgi:hypothetical protein
VTGGVGKLLINLYRKSNKILIYFERIPGEPIIDG